MNIFIAGVHGVGKTYLASQLPKEIGLVHTSASTLIKNERALPEWNTDKRVNDVDANQVALAAAVERHNRVGTRLLLDGHFVLLNPQNQFLYLGTEVFKSLNLEAVVLLETNTLTIASRIKERDDRESDTAHIENFINAERHQAQIVCSDLGIPLLILDSPNPDTFSAAISSIVLRASGSAAPADQ